MIPAATEAPKTKRRRTSKIGLYLTDEKVLVRVQDEAADGSLICEDAATLAQSTIRGPARVNWRVVKPDVDG